MEEENKEKQEEKQNIDDEKEEKTPKKPTMLLMILISFGAITFLSFFGSRKAYGTYAKEINLLKEPALTLFFRGLHDGVVPWGSGKERKEPVHEDKAASAFFFHIAEPGEESIAWEEGLPEPETETETETEEMTEPVARYVYTDAPEGYFADTLFVGDSRTDGLAMYSSLKKEADFASKTSLSIYNLFEWTLNFRSPGKGEEKKLLSDILNAKQYKRIYLSVGINELGTNPDNYLNAFRNAIHRVKEAQPDALVVVEAIMRVTNNKSNSDPTINNPNIDARNNALRALAEEEDAFYVDMNEAVVDGNAGLRSELTNDGVHLKASEYELWVDFLRSHALVLLVE